ncbi:MAG: menaquinone biosynthesis protein [Thermoanaerobaculaceae bacterium]|jgi:predicted solute-binding protein|nr:menaquinone biosynthesis protein [Thermoanaerobaculaceae bacterium]
MTGHPSPFRVAGIRYLNARPLLAGLAAGIEAPFPYRFETGDPADCAEALGARKACAALVPVATLPGLDGVELLPQLGIACRGAVESVLLVSRVEIPRIRTLAVHSASRSSATLARLWLAECHGVRPELSLADPPLAAMLSDADAAIIIGDPAMRERGRTGHLEVDLGEAWAAWTGLPFVFGVWALAPGAPTGTRELLAASHAHAHAHWSELVPTWAAAHQLPVPQVRSYLERTLHFQLDAADVEGMNEFLRRAGAAGVLPG